MDRSIISQYLNNFRRVFSVFLKDGVGIHSLVYGFENGSMIVIELGFSELSKDEFRSDSSSLSEAMNKSNLFDALDNDYIVQDTSIFLKDNKIIIMKSDKLSEYQMSQVHNDINKILKTIRDEQNQN